MVQKEVKDTIQIMFGKHESMILSKLRGKSEVVFDYNPEVSRAANRLKTAGLIEKTTKGRRPYWSLTEQGEAILGMMYAIDSMFADDKIEETV